MTQVKMFFGESVEDNVNQWLRENPNIQIVDIKLSSISVALDNSYGGLMPEYKQDVMVIYSTEVASIEQQEDSGVVTSEDGWYHFCRDCWKEVFQGNDYCHACGNRLTWEHQTQTKRDTHQS